MQTFDFIGAPYDGASTLGRPGSRYAPDRIREALSWITQRIEKEEIYSLESNRMLHVGQKLINDTGNIDLPLHDLEETLAKCDATVQQSLQNNHIPMLVGGDDCMLYPAAKGLHDFYNNSENIGIIHFDAHLDLMDESYTQGRFSQSSGMRRSLELDNIRPENCIQVASRHFNFPASGYFKQSESLRHMSAHEFHELGTHKAVEKILDQVKGADKILFSFDIDSIDPAFAPGAGANEPGGLTSAQALEAIKLLAPHCDSFALTEVNPLHDPTDSTVMLAAYILFYFAVYRSQGSNN